MWEKSRVGYHKQTNKTKLYVIKSIVQKNNLGLVPLKDKKLIPLIYPLYKSYMYMTFLAQKSFNCTSSQNNNSLN